MSTILRFVAPPLYIAFKVVSFGQKLIRSTYLESKTRWMQITVVNETGLVLKFDDSSYLFRSGRFWTGPGNIEANSESTFSVCNKAFGVGVNGRVLYHLSVSPECTVPVLIQYVNEFFGDIRLTANFVLGENLSKETVVKINGNYRKVVVSCAPGCHGKVSLFYTEAEQTAPSNN